MSLRTLRRLSATTFIALLLSALSVSMPMSPACAAVDESDLLPVDQAFVLTAKATSRERIEFSWKIAPGYYLYRQRMGVTATDASFRTNPLQLPDGIHKHDEFFGDVQIYHGGMVTAVQTGFAASDVDAASFTVKYQGCADAGVCYPPQRRVVKVMLPPISGSTPAIPLAAAEETTTPASSPLGGVPANKPLNTIGGNLAVAGSNSLPLPAEQAFRFEAIIDTPNRLLLRFTPAKGYYLYRDKTTFALKGEKALVLPGQPQWPPAQQHQDEHFGNVAVYFDQVDVPLPLLRQTTDAQRLVVDVSFQGCQNDGICYPPMQRQVTLDLPAGGQVSEIKQILPGGRTQTLPSIASLFTALLLALGGGLILNLMPCVLPVLSLKALSLVQAGESHARARSHALWYTAGVLLSFAALGAIAIGLRQAGLALGWGFQLQQPLVIAALAYLMFAIGLSLSGMFQFGAGVAGVGQKLTEKSGPAGDFFTGVLAVIVASPCTAPFMGTALAFAFASSTAMAMAVFLALGLGLALPFLAIAFVPALASRLPKPGPWMETFKQVLAFPMYLTAAWLVSVLAAQRGSTGVLYLLVGAVLLAFGLWWWERGRYSRHRSVRPLALLVMFVALLPLIAIHRLPPVAKQAAESGTVAYSANALAELRAQHRVVFVDMTADWCVSCKVNEKAVLSRPAFYDAMAAANAVYMVGDYTNVDRPITEFLEAHHAVGVPLYVVYPRNGGEGEVLPNILTQSIVSHALARAAAQ